MNYQWLLFDADGTLFDYDQAEAMALQRAFVKFGFEFHPDYTLAYRQINEQIWIEFERGQITQADLRTKRFTLLGATLGLEFDSQNFSDSYLAYLGEGTDLINGALELLQALAGKVKMMLITNGLKDVQRSRLSRSPIQAFFADVVISEEVGAAKPDRAIFEVCFQKMDYPRKKDVLIIGDSLTSDIRGGNHYGIDTCWFNPNGRLRDQDVSIQYEIRQLQELLEIVLPDKD